MDHAPTRYRTLYVDHRAGFSTVTDSLALAVTVSRGFAIGYLRPSASSRTSFQN
jgi:hypothetical protein